uniref:Uncharacterized protein n=1 Tax=Skeletonema marinoi TaxID=267567 RepID=A0A7S1VX36_9STRA|mmetsp:Transcript_31148/g.62760  ORF Transcript_31148/g.62760 Transcript_31148/m.62760 type:complete len:283 (-) Transcript_31148:49-897(-)|eukprot:scaffold10417_cov137-Skeletonema_marinoi.AAC.27
MGNCCTKEEPQRPGAFADTSSSSEDVYQGSGSYHSSTNHSTLTPSPFGGMLTPDGASPAIDPTNLTPVTSSHGHDSSQLQSGSEHLQQIEQMDESERQRRIIQIRLEQTELARRETIVTSASQSMVPVGGSQGSRSIGGGMILNHPHQRGGGVNTYYDPAYAAAAAQDILNSAARTGGLMFADDQATKAAWNVSVMGSAPMKASSSRGGGGTQTTSKDVMDTLSRGQWDKIQLGSRGGGVAGCGGEDPEYYVDDLADAFWDNMVPTKMNLFGGCPSIVENLP